MIIKEGKKTSTYLNLARKLKKKKAVEHNGDHDTNGSLCDWNDPQRLVKKMEELEIRGRIETIRSTALLRSARILRRVLKT